ncbi:hypothetical protein F4775DRAFT_183189 [Biscogniauxia sp. FL1348]|nr:hypothetical protein F4775DRAFT_183189 [Biscogniauxia sp. FL1348]
MEDLRDAEKTVSTFAALIDRLRPDKPAQAGAELSELEQQLAKRNDSNGSQKSSRSSKSPKGGSKVHWRSRKNHWEESIEGWLWNELEKPQSEVAQQYRVDQTALKEFISSPDMMELGGEFAKHYGTYKGEKSYWVAEDLYFDLQAVKQGDTDAARWTSAKAYKKEWDLADHLVRFVLLAEHTRLCANRDEWNGWEWNFAVKVGFYLSILRCYTVREAKQRQLARSLAHSRQTSQSIYPHKPEALAKPPAQIPPRKRGRLLVRTFNIGRTN